MVNNPLKCFLRAEYPLGTLRNKIIQYNDFEQFFVSFDTFMDRKILWVIKIKTDNGEVVK
jgi:hypothetical protein